MGRLGRWFSGLVFCVLLSLIFSSPVFSDCRGCCSHHGGVVCDGGVTRCADGTPLSEKCKAKGCNVCDKEPGPVGSGKALEEGFPSQPLSIANFNIQVFGKSKAGKKEVMGTLAQIIRKFDVVAIEEIRDKSGTAIQRLEAGVDRLGEDYSVAVGPRLGRTSSKEQYAFIYRSDRLVCEETYTFNDSGGDLFHREPYIGLFRDKASGLRFVLIAIHTDPDEATEEIYALSLAAQDARSHFSGESHIVILGDLNADCSYYDENDLGVPLRASSYSWLITNAMDTNLAKSNCAYDRIIVSEEMRSHFTGHAGVYRFDETLGLTPKQAKAVSDHYPVYAMFSMGGAGRVASLPLRCGAGGS